MQTVTAMAVKYHSPIPSPDDSWKLSRQCLGTSCYQVTASLEAKQLQVNKIQSNNSMALFLPTQSPRSSTIIRKGSPSKPKSREYSSHGASDFAHEAVFSPHLKHYVQRHSRIADVTRALLQVQ
jgi:hypothetical protein